MLADFFILIAHSPCYKGWQYHYCISSKNNALYKREERKTSDLEIICIKAVPRGTDKIQDPYAG